MYYSYIEIEYVATSFSPARTDLAVKLLKGVVSRDGKRAEVLQKFSNLFTKIAAAKAELAKAKKQQNNLQKHPNAR